MQVIKPYRFIAVLVLMIFAAVIVYRYNNKVIKLEPVRIDAIEFADVVSISDSLVPPIVYKRIPDLKVLDVPERKKAFIDIVLPSILLVQDRIETDRNRVNEIINMDEIIPSDTGFVSAMMKVYKVKSIFDLPSHMITPPVCIILAQAALESGWGTSRFFLEGNNIFGMWSYSDNHNRMAAGEKRGERQIYVRKFDDIYASVLNYYQTLGRLRAYANFRKALETETDPIVIVAYLNKYSERGEAYTNTVASLIRQNDMEKYEDYQLLPEWALEYDLTYNSYVVNEELK
jgi:Bax protein